MKYIISIFFSFCFLSANSQSSINTGMFHDGVFLDFNQVKTNTPITAAQIISSLNPNHPFFLKQLIAQDSLHYIDLPSNQPMTIATKDIWGYAANNVLYINYQHKFNRIAQMGSIALFLAKVTVTKTYNTMDNYYSSLYLPHNETYNTTELQRYIIDFSNGEVYPLSTQSLAAIISSDSDLYLKYMQLSKRKRKKMIFLYIREFNKKHPLSIPK